MEFFELNQDDKLLIQRAMETLKISNDGDLHTVGAALLCDDGSIFTGVNCYQIHGSCAEYIAVGAAITSGKSKQSFCTIVAVSDRGLLAPCGNCRQLLIDYAPQINVILCDNDGKIVKVNIKDLIPFAYVRHTY